MHGRILVATDGSAKAIGALRMARSLENAGMGRVFVIAAHEPPLYYDDLTPGMADETRLEAERAGAEVMRKRVVEQLETIGPETEEWHLGIETGSPPETIVDEAEAREVVLILTGLGKRSLGDRILGRETAIRVMQLARVPVLAVHEAAGDLPRRVLIAEDFSDPSDRAAATALDLAPADAEVHLAHVADLTPRVEAEFITGRPTEGSIGILEARLHDRVDLLARAGRPVAPHLLQGDPVEELLRLAERLDADLIAVGRHGRGFLGRVLIGSVSSSIVRNANRSVLVVPHAQAPEPE